MDDTRTNFIDTYFRHDFYLSLGETITLKTITTLHERTFVCFCLLVAVTAAIHRNPPASSPKRNTVHIHKLTPQMISVPVVVLLSPFLALVRCFFARYEVSSGLVDSSTILLLS
jgi:hypothetical protein